MPVLDNVDMKIYRLQLDQNPKELIKQIIMCVGPVYPMYVCMYGCMYVCMKIYIILYTYRCMPVIRLFALMYGLRGTLWRIVGHGGALVEAITLNRRVEGSTPALAAM